MFASRILMQTSTMGEKKSLPMKMSDVPFTIKTAIKEKSLQMVEVMANAEVSKYYHC